MAEQEGFRRTFEAKLAAGIRAAEEHPNEPLDEYFTRAELADFTYKPASATSNREAWLEERRTYLGATDLAAIMGVHPYASPLTVYCSKMGITDPVEETAQMRRGNRMEPYVAQTFSEVYDKPYRKAQIVRHPDKPYLAVNPDFETDIDGETFALETKSHKFYLRHQYGDPWSDIVPDHELIQGTWQCRLGGYSACILAVAFGMDEEDLIPFRIPYNPSLGDMVEEAGDRFWHDHILAGIPPPVTGLEADSDLIKRMYPLDRGVVMVASEEINAAVRSLKAARERIATETKTKDEAENTIKAFMGSASQLQTALGVITWKTSKGSPSWKSIAEALHPSPALIAQHTPDVGPRKFLVPFKGEK